MLWYINCAWNGKTLHLCTGVHDVIQLWYNKSVSERGDTMCMHNIAKQHQKHMNEYLRKGKG